MSEKQAVVRTADGLVENVIIADSNFDPGEGYELIAVGTRMCGPGYTYDAGTDEFIAPPSEESEPWDMSPAVDENTRDIIVDQFRAAGGNAITAEQAIAANGNIPQEVKDLSRATIQMFYLLYVAMTGDRISAAEDDYFPV